MAQVDQLLVRRDLRAPAYVRLREHLVAARTAAGLSQESLAERIGRPQSAIAKIELGERSVDVVEFVAIAAILSMDIEAAVRAIRSEISQ